MTADSLQAIDNANKTADSINNTLLKQQHPTFEKLL
jgi:hypothetical protein